jgi:LmbE family N-acetylglucosaminyl deacetylase
MRAMAMVAHPDDCVIFAYSYIYNHPQYEWTVCYLTYTDLDNRGKEFREFWQRRNIKTKFLGFLDQWNSDQNCPGTIEFDPAKLAITQAITDQDLILTHGAEGEYGHPHHVLVHKATIDHSNRVLFAGPGQGHVKYSVESHAYSLEEIPLHRNIVEGFHKHNHTNEYIICKNI